MKLLKRNIFTFVRYVKFMAKDFPCV